MSDFYNKYAEHIIDTEFYAQYQEEYFLERMQQLEDKLSGLLKSKNIRLSRTEYKKLLAECQKLADDEIDKYIEDYKKEREEFAEKEKEFLKNLFLTALGLAFATTLINHIKDRELFLTATDLGEFKGTLKANVEKAIQTPLLSAYIFGTPPSTVDETMKSLIEKTVKLSSSFVHTDVSSVQRSLLKTSTLDTKVQWVSMLDERVCPVCGSYSGQVFNSIAEAPDCPVHERCRCYLVPVEDDIHYETYSEWLKAQPDSTQYKILGPSRYALYKAGVDVKGFTSKGRKLTLKELYDR